MVNEELNSTKVNDNHSLMEKLLENNFPVKILRRGEIIDGSIIETSEKGLLLDIGQKSEGVVLSREMKTLDPESSKVGTDLIVYVMNPETGDGTILLSVDRAKGEQGWRVLERAMEDDQNMFGKIIAINKGGAVVESEGIQGFIPLSQLIGKSRELYMSDNEEDKETLIGMKVEFRITELNRRRNRAIFSERAASEAMKLKIKAKKIHELNVGDIVQFSTTGGGAVALRYENNLTAAVYFSGVAPGGSQPANVFIMGFPFETIYDDWQKISLAGMVLSNFGFNVQLTGQEPITPIQFSLLRNYPNPFNNSTTFQFTIPSSGNVNINVYNLLGQVVATPLNEIRGPGLNTTYFSGNSLASGMYLYAIKWENRPAQSKFLLVK